MASNLGASEIKVAVVPLHEASFHADGSSRGPVTEAVALAKHVREYPLPGALQTHEMLSLPLRSTLLISQQTNSTLLCIKLHPLSHRPASVTRFLVGSFWSGLHGLAPSHHHPGNIWATLQFTSQLVRLRVISPTAVTIQQVIQLPVPRVRGPHCIIESGDHLWVTCKDSCHVVRVNHVLPENTPDVDRFSIYPTSRRPILVAVHGISKDVYASLDLENKIWHLASSLDKAFEIEVPSSRGNTPVGLVTGPDGNVWFSLLGDANGGKGAFAQITSFGEFTWFHLTTPLGRDAGLIHLAFDCTAKPYRNQEPMTAWLLGSTLLSAVKGVDAIFAVAIDPIGKRIQVEHTICFPTQRCASHRVLWVPDSGLYVSQLSVSSLAHIEGTDVVAPLKRMGETTDYYARFGEGVPLSHYRFVDKGMEAGTDVPSVDRSVQNRGKKRKATSRKQATC